jgi:hypothetical protein
MGYLASQATKHSKEGQEGRTEEVRLEGKGS